MNDIAVIHLTNGGFTVVDSDMFDHLNKWQWQLNAKCRVTRCQSDGSRLKSKTIYLHRVVNKTPTGLETDHVNRYALDNRRVNLRTVTKSQNSMNRPRQANNTSGFKGVTWSKYAKKWTAKLKLKGKSIHLGYYDSAIESARAYNKAAVDKFGVFAYLNSIPEGR